MLSHELRTPLSVIKIHLDVLELRRGSDPTDMRSIGITQQAVRRLQDLFSEKLREMFSAASLSAERSHVQLGTSLKSIVDEFVALWPGQRIHLDVGEAAIDVVVSASMLKTAMFNLLENAKKYGDREGGTNVSLSRQGDHALISVTNKAVILLPENLESLFEKSDRGLADRSISGTGVGLFLVRLIAESHGGKVVARRTDQDQFTIQMLFPLPEAARH